MSSEGDIMIGSPNTKPSLDLDRIRKIIRSYIDRHHYLAAEFWANKLVSLSGGSPLDVYYLAQCYLLTRQYHRAILLINNHELTKNATCRYLAARCYFEAGEHQAALDVLDQTDKHIPLGKNIDSTPINIPEVDDPSIECSIHLLRGYIQEASDNRALASESFKLAMQADPMCYEAFHSLTQHHMLSLKEETELLSSLSLNQSFSETEEILIKSVYENRMNKYSGTKFKTPLTIAPLENNLDSLSSQAERLYYQCDFNQCFKLTQEVLHKDPYHSDCLPIHVACLVELRQANTLFLLGHKLVDLYPENSLSWFAVGCYYYLIGKNDQARRFLSKATSLKRAFGPAWIAYGHSFAAESEHDQARAAYYKAAQLMKGCHLPLLYIGMEYSLTNNPKFAEMFFKEALEIAPEDPFVHHELGVVAYSNQDYTLAESYFEKALKVVEEGRLSVVPEKWASLLNNLGQTHCKLGKYESSIELHQHALRACPGTASSYASIGLCQSYLGRYQDAIVSLHKALSLQRDYVVASTLLSHLMNQVVVNMPAFEGDEGVLAFDLVNIDSTTATAFGSSKGLSSSAGESKSLLGSSIGQPVMHSSEVGGTETSHQSQSLGETSSVMIIEDMAMDDSP